MCVAAALAAVAASTMAASMPLAVPLISNSTVHELDVLQLIAASVNVRHGAMCARTFVMLESPEDRCERYRIFKAIDDAFKAGDIEALKTALGNSPRWFDETMPHEFGLGHPLEYAIYWSPLGFIEDLIALGSSVNYKDDAGFPCLIAALSTDRGDRLDVLRLLIRHGADHHRRGINDCTPLHYAAGLRDLEALRLLLASDADPTLRTRIDDLSTLLEDAEAAGFTEGATLLRQAMADRSGH